MTELIGEYSHIKGENLDQYYAALGVPLVARKMMSFTSPSLKISKEGDNWTIKTSTLLRTSTCTFKLGEEYDEDMPGGKLKCTTTMENEKTLKTVTIGPENVKITRVYEVTDEGCVLILTHEESGVQGKRYFKRNA